MAQRHATSAPGDLRAARGSARHGARPRPSAAGRARRGIGQRAQPRVVVEVGDGHLRVARRAARRPAGPRPASRRRGRRSRPPGRRPARRARRATAPASQPVGAGEVRRAPSSARGPGSGHGSASRSTLPECGSAARRRGPAAAPARRAACSASAVAGRGRRRRRGRRLATGSRPAAGVPLAVRPHARPRRRDTPGRAMQRRVDLAELDPPAAELDLVVGAALEDQAAGLEPDQVAAAVGAVPAERSASAAYFSASLSGSR